MREHPHLKILATLMATQSLPIAEGLRDALSQLTFRHLLQMYKNGI